MTQGRLKAVIAVVVSASFAAAPWAFGEDQRAREYQIKAAFIYNFIQFVGWPEDAFEDDDSPIIVGILGLRDPFQGTLNQLVSGRRVHGRSVDVTLMDAAGELRPLHVLFFPAAESADAGAVLSRLEAIPVLTIGETEDFLRRNGIIRFFIEENRIRFEVSLEAAREARLTMSSKLLKLARIFKRGR